MYTEEEIHPLLKALLLAKTLPEARKLVSKFVNENNIDLFAEFESDSDLPESIENIDDWITL